MSLQSWKFLTLFLPRFRLAGFLGVALTPEKLAALRRRSALGADADATVTTSRLGRVGDHRHHLTAAHWLRLDRLFRARGTSAHPLLAPLAPDAVFSEAVRGAEGKRESA